MRELHRSLMSGGFTRAAAGQISEIRVDLGRWCDSLDWDALSPGQAADMLTRSLAIEHLVDEVTRMLDRHLDAGVEQ